MKARYFLVKLIFYVVQGGSGNFWISLLYLIKLWQSEIHPSGHKNQLRIFIKRIKRSLVKSLKNL